MRPWMYIVAALVGSLLGGAADALLYREGGAMFMKIGLVAGPVLLHVAGKLRAKRDDVS